MHTHPETPTPCEMAEQSKPLEVMAAFALEHCVFRMSQLREALERHFSNVPGEDFEVYFSALWPDIAQMLERRGVAAECQRMPRQGEQENLYTLVVVSTEVAPEVATLPLELRIKNELDRLFCGRPVIETDELTFYIAAHHGFTFSSAEQVVALLVSEGFLFQTSDGYRQQPEPPKESAEQEESVPHQETAETDVALGPPVHTEEPVEVVAFELPPAQPGDELVGQDEPELLGQTSEEIAYAETGVALGPPVRRDHLFDADADTEPRVKPEAKPEPEIEVEVTPFTLPSPPKVSPPKTPIIHAQPPAPVVKRAPEVSIPGVDNPFTHEECTIATTALERLAWISAREQQGIPPTHLIEYVCRQLRAPRNNVVTTLRRLVSRGHIAFDSQTKRARLSQNVPLNTPAFKIFMDKVSENLKKTHDSRRR